ncbi:RIP metalloprotease RseP [Vreelandella subglaciescola]|jgi:regulator of sigma E protease|uniref:Zinc metalloprotease n=1 Tax=Vreelandella subglaciescola TaxID=29571 RepID=A0A1M7G7B4_9GAMM|nr:RIP metalloprotease RseP [Halomonas subglaciescola]SHM11817.1 site-2 protease. Metallo peptidase. MEROPS family M50B [Halomonas subglaciescola]
MGLIQNILAVIVVLGLLVTFHEFGHFWVARRCGIKVLRFSVGFGKPLWSRVDRHGTEFAVAAIPLGGYVKMLDEREAPVPPEEQHRAFNRKPVLQRIAVVIAGPAANFLLAIVAYWALFVAGTSVVVPKVGAVAPQSPAFEAGLRHGDELTGVQGEAVSSWEDVNLALVGLIGHDGELAIEARPEATNEPRRYTLAVERYMVRQNPPRPLKSLGITPWQPAFPPVLGQIISGEAAAQAGLEVGDRIVEVNGEAIDDWMAFVEHVRQSAGRALEISVIRSGEARAMTLTPGSHPLESGAEIGYIGAGVQPVEWPDELRREIRFGPVEAVGEALSRTGEMTLLTLDSIRKMLVGLISPSNLSGPITIAKISGDSARAGLDAFVGFLAYLSISLGVLNLLPIPVLDGGHLLYYVVELVRGRPVSERAQGIGLRIGLAMVGTLMLMALYFDLMRLW